MVKKIAFCFLIYDIINHEELWNIFLKNIDSNKYSIYIHYKINTPLKYFDKYKLNNCIETAWGDISLVRAQNLLLQAGMNDNITNFIFLSNSCIPLKSFDIVYESIDISYSYFNLFPQEDCFPYCNFLLESIDKRYIHKAHQWCILTRKHADILCNSNIECFNNKIICPDEYCYITLIHLFHLENEIKVTFHSPTEATTFTNWLNMNYKYNYSNENLGTYNPTTQYNLSNE